MSNPLSIRVVLALLLLCPGCGGGGESPVLSGPGESCTKTADCEPGLKCIALVCVSDRAADVKQDAAGELVVDGFAELNLADAGVEDAGSDMVDSQSADMQVVDVHDASDDGIDSIAADVPKETDSVDGFSDACAPSCVDKECGADGCGGNCGECLPGFYCDDAGACQASCGNGECSADEDCSTCPEDCGICCAPGCAQLEECEQTASGWSCAAASVNVPEGEFWMGCNDWTNPSPVDTDCENNEYPMHPVVVDAYAIGRTEVTNSQFASFLSALEVEGKPNQCEFEMQAFDCVDPSAEFLQLEQEGEVWSAVEGYSSHPVVGASWYAANAYCSWIGRRLCTEAEWEKAARGGCEWYEAQDNGSCHAASQKFPWGNTPPTCELAVIGGCDGTATSCSNSPAGDSPYGLCDMAGNAPEWVSDVYGSNYYCAGEGADTTFDGPWANCQEGNNWPGWPIPWSNPQGPSAGETRVYRGGGSYSTDPESVRVSRRYYLAPHKTAAVGLRCCSSGQ